jgi:hypothetical protein
MSEPLKFKIQNKLVAQNEVAIKNKNISVSCDVGLICDSRKIRVYTLEFEIDGMVC